MSRPCATVVILVILGSTAVARAETPCGRPAAHDPMDTLVSCYMRSPSGFDLEFGAGGLLLGGL